MAARLLLCASLAGEALGFLSYQASIPNGARVVRAGQAWPGVGHALAAGGPSAKNPFGAAFASAGRSWTQALCRADSDGDGQSNGVELGDPDCTWTRGATPSRTTDISHPGYADSTTSSAAPSPGGTATTTTASTSTASTSTRTTETATGGQGPGNAVGTAADVALAAGLRLSFQPAGSDSAELTVRLDSSAWVAFGISAGDSVSMSGNGQGADVFACTNGEVRRYWVASQSIAGPGVPVPNSTCTQASGSTTMTFTRRVAAEGLQQRAITPGAVQQVIYAHGDDGVTAMGYHGRSRRGGQGIDFASGATGAAAKRRGEASLLLHMVLMSLAWGGLIPFGAVVANRLKSVEGAPKGAWFKLHRTVQSVGWLLQLLGFAAAVWHAQEHSSHFSGGHSFIGLAVVVVGTLQPLNAALRPHPEPRTKARVAFEVVHKGLGWLAVLLGVLNVAIGIYLTTAKDYETAVVATALAIAVLSLLPSLAVFALAWLWPGNPVSRLLTGAGATEGRCAV